jgi:HAMP domain-containing protein
MKLSILQKLLSIMLILTVVPLVILGALALSDAKDLGLDAADDARTMGEANLASAKEIGQIAVADSGAALDALAQEAIETRAEVEANRIADFLHERDSDVLSAKGLPLTEEAFRAFLNSKQKDVIYGEETAAEPIYKEITYLDTSGAHVLKVTSRGYDGEDIDLEDFQRKIGGLGDGKIWVSRLWGELLYITEAYAGTEKPDGQRYEGYYRWVTPVYEDGAKTGYISLKLDARHIMEYVDHISPTESRYQNLPDATTGNYAYLVDDEGWLTSHAREYHVKGVHNDGALATPLMHPDKEIREDTKPLFFPHLATISTDLAEIHTVRIAGGETSGSQMYDWAGLTKWIAFATVPYNTGSSYDDDNFGFGWIAVGAQIDTFHEPADLTALKIDTMTQSQATQIDSMVAETEANIREATEGTSTQNTILYLTIIIAVIVIIVGYIFARSLTNPIKNLKEVAEKVSKGDLDVEVNVKTKDELGDLAYSFKRLVRSVKILSIDEEE